MAERAGFEVMSAPAGSGKTTRLVREYLRCISQLPVPSVIAITFTRKAAAELVDRVGGVLSALAQGRTLDSRQRELAEGVTLTRARAAAALELLPAAPVSTVDSFVHALLQEFLLDAALPLPDGARVPVDGPLELESNVEDVYRVAAREVLEELSDDAKAVLAHATVKDAASDLSLLARESGLSRLSAAGLCATLATHLDDDAARLLCALPEGQVNGAGKVVHGAVTAWLAAREGPPPDGLLLWLLQLGKKSDAYALREALLGKTLGLHGLAPVVPLCEGLKLAEGFGQEGSLRSADALGEALIRLGSATRGRALRQMAERGRLGYDEMLVAATELCRTARPALRERYRALLVDEVQDTNPAQLELYRALHAVGERGAFRAVFVGDGRQSIYRFRGADPHGWAPLLEEARLQDALTELTVNYRSSHLLVKAQRVLVGALREMGEEGLFPLEGLAAAPGAPEGTLEGATWTAPVVVVDGADDESLARAPLHEKVLTLFARRLTERWAHGVEEAKESAAVLVPSWVMGRRAVEQLRQEGVRAQLWGERALLESRVAQDLRRLLQALLDPTDGVSLVGILKHPSIGLSDAGLLTLQQGPGLAATLLEEDDDSAHGEEAAFPRPDDGASTKAVAEKMPVPSGADASHALHAADEAAQQHLPARGADAAHALHTPDEAAQQHLPADSTDAAHALLAADEAAQQHLPADSTDAAEEAAAWRPLAGNAEPEPLAHGLNAKDARALAAARPLLRQARRELGRRPTSEVLETLLHGLRWRALLAAGPEGFEAIAPGEGLAQLDLLLDLVRALEERGTDPCHALEVLTPDAHRQEDLPAVRLHAGEQTVEVVTVHGAKGLAWDHVALLGVGLPGGGPSYSPRTFRLSRLNGRPSLGIKVDPAGALKASDDPVAALLALHEVRADRAESLRELYVGFTRARTSVTLGFTAMKGRRPQRVSEVVRDALLTRREELGAALCVVPSRSVPARIPEPLWRPPTARRAPFLATAPAPAGLQLTQPTALADHLTYAARQEIRGRMQDQARLTLGSGAPPFPDHPLLRATPENILGELIHGWLEHWAFKGAASATQADGYLKERWGLLDEGSGPDIRGLLSGWLRTAGEAIRDGLPGFAALLEGKLHFEWPVLGRLGGSVVTGRTDLVVEKPDGGLVVVDFKAGSRVAHGLQDIPGFNDYALQLEAYHRLLAATGRRVDEVGLLYVRSPGPSWVRFPLTPAAAAIAAPAPAPAPKALPPKPAPAGPRGQLSLFDGL